MWGQWRGHLILWTALRVRWPGPPFRGGETEAQRDQNPSTLAEKAVRVDGKNDSLLGTQRAPRLPLEVGKSEWKRPETPCWRSPTPHQAPPGPAHTLGRGPRPQVRCLLPLTRAGRVETRPLAFGGVWSTPCARHAPLWLAHSHPRPSMGREDVLPLPVWCRLCGGARAHLHSAVRSAPDPRSPYSFSVSPRGGWRQALIPPPLAPQPHLGISTLPRVSATLPAHRICPAWVLDTF